MIYNKIIKNSFLTLCVFFFANQAQSAQTTDISPVVIISSNANESEYTKLVNILSNATVYSTVTNKILNGSGNNSFVPLKQGKPVSVLLDQMSYFDLYMLKSLQQARLENQNTEIHLLPLENRLAGLADVQMKKTKSGINDLVDAIMPLFKTSVKFESPSQLNSKENLQLIRSSQLSALKLRYPLTTDQSSQQNSLEANKWMLASYLPISVSAKIHLDGEWRRFQSAFIFPAMGFPKALYQNINGMSPGQSGMIPLHFSSRGEKNTIKMQPINSSYGSFTDISFYPNLQRRNAMSNSSADQREFDQINISRALRVEFVKESTRPHVMGLGLSFGYLPQNASSVYSMNMDAVKTKDEATKLIKNADFGLVIKGDMKIDKALISNDFIREKINEYYSSMFDIRLVLHKAYFDLNRLPISDPALKYLEEGMNQFKLDLFLNNDIGYELKNLKYRADMSVVNLVISVKPEIQKKILDGEFLFKDGGIRQSMLRNFCLASAIYTGKSKIEDSQLSKCQLVFSSAEEFKSNFIAKFINESVMKILNLEMKTKVGSEAAAAEVMIDKTIEDVIATLMSELQKAKSEITDILSRTP